MNIDQQGSGRKLFEMSANKKKYIENVLYIRTYMLGKQRNATNSSGITIKNSK